MISPRRSGRFSRVWGWYWTYKGPPPVWTSGLDRQKATRRASSSSGNLMNGLEFLVKALGGKFTAKK